MKHRCTLLEAWMYLARNMDLLSPRLCLMEGEFAFPLSPTTQQLQTVLSTSNVAEVKKYTNIQVRQRLLVNV